MDDLHSFRTRFGRIEEANIEREVLAIVVRHTGGLRRLIDKRHVGLCAGTLLGGFGSVPGRPRSGIPGIGSQRRAFGSRTSITPSPRPEARKTMPAASSARRT